MPVIVLADASGSMREAGKIGALNQAMRDMMECFRDADDVPVEILVAVIAFGGSAARLHLPLSSAGDVNWEDLSAGGKTPLGSALDLARELIEDRARIPERSYSPAIVLVSDGRPTDDWQAAWLRLSDSPRAQKALRLALAVGADCDRGMLEEFIGRPEIRVCEAHEARHIKSFFAWVSMSVVARSVSPNPNDWSPAPFEPDQDDF